MLKFIATDAESIRQKRKQTQRACDHCRKRKRRCKHDVFSTPTLDSIETPSDMASSATSRRTALTTDEIDTVPGNNHPASHITKQNTHTSGDHLVVETSTTRSEQGQSLVPDWRADPSLPSQSHFEDDVHSQRSNVLDSRFIGDLNPEGMLLAATSPSTSRGVASSDSIGTWLAEKLSKTINQNNSPGLAELSPSSLFYGSESVVQKVLLPLLKDECLLLLPSSSDIETLSSVYFEKIHPIFPVIDEQGFRNLDAADPARVLLLQGICLAASLDINSKEHLRLSNKDVLLTHRDFADQIFAAMRTSIEIGLVEKKIILIQALALMALSRDGPEGGDLSSQLCSRSIQYLYSLGLHVEGRYHDAADHYAITLVCCVWALDRISAALHGRAVVMHERDVGRDLVACSNQQQSSFRVLLEVVALLDKVIELYRPTTGPEVLVWTGDFPSFEDILSRCTGLQTPTPLLATTEVLYHAVAILSCRSRSWETSPRSNFAYVRQVYSASRITSTVGVEFIDQLTFLPFVPYAVSLSLSMAYREMRYSKVPMYRVRARVQLQANCSILDELGEIFWSASTMSDMGKSTLREMDRVVTAVVESQKRNGHPQVPTENSNRGENNQQYHTTSTSQTDENQQDLTIRASTDNTFIDASFSTDQEFDFYHLNEMPGFDVFELFDPTFDLDGVDACLGRNLDLSFPMNAT